LDNDAERFKAYSVPAIDRALSVLELLAESRRGFSLSEVSPRLSLPKSSTHLILLTLQKRGYLQMNSQTGHYCFGLRLMSLSRSTLENLDLREEAKPFLCSLMKKTGLTVHMAVLERHEAVVIEKIEAPGMLRLTSYVGRRLDVNCTGVGKALIAFLSDEEFAKLIRGPSFPRHNHRTITSNSELRRELARVRELGYSLDDQEDEPGFRCIGAPLFGSSGAVVAAVSVAGTTLQIPLEKVPTLGAQVKRAAAEISSSLGYVPNGGSRVISEGGK